MSDRSSSRDSVEPWAGRSGEWYKRVRQIQFINAPRPPSSNLFNGEASLGGGAMSHRRALNLREIGVILAGISFGGLVSLTVVLLCKLFG